VVLQLGQILHLERMHFGPSNLVEIQILLLPHHQMGKVLDESILVMESLLPLVRHFSTQIAFGTLKGLHQVQTSQLLRAAVMEMQPHLQRLISRLQQLLEQNTDCIGLRERKQ
jgi:hypothetical protein